MTQKASNQIWASATLRGPYRRLSVRVSVQFAVALLLALTLLAPLNAEGADRNESSGAWIAAARIIRNGQPSGSGVYLNSGLIITAAHLTAAEAEMGVRIA